MLFSIILLHCGDATYDMMYVSVYYVVVVSRFQGNKFRSPTSYYSYSRKPREGTVF
jgi:hypothetical protein